MRRVKVTINGRRYSEEVEPRLLLAHFIRDVAGLTGTHIGCDTTNCGACTVLVDGKTVKSCTLLAVQADGSRILTIEGVSPKRGLNPIQNAFLANHGLQCGYCTPGMVMQALWFLKQNPNPTEEEIRWGISGNLCRCTGYDGIVKAIRAASRETRKARKSRR